MSATKIFALIKDGAWHSVTELSKQTGIKGDKLIEYFQFLDKKGVAEYDNQNQRIKIKPEWKNMIPEKT